MVIDSYYVIFIGADYLGTLDPFVNHSIYNLGRFYDYEETSSILIDPTLPRFYINIREPDGWTSYLQYGSTNYDVFISYSVSEFVTRELYTNDNNETFFLTSLSHIDMLDVSSYVAVTLTDQHVISYIAGHLHYTIGILSAVSRLVFFNKNIYCHQYYQNLISTIEGPGTLYLTPFNEALFINDNVTLEERELVIIPLYKIMMIHTIDIIHRPG